ncbi:LLM class flavin-dependent oxidoreductase [Nocardioides sp. CER19]|uniref:LLM class flavin-dependent oxidoreductase n=1 Tax=Nocardioides sp. CER19 TaxID=3038538 RepID=UPI00244912D8|nr:LLM class flavin-dependent oxidoreductase [Nocardioides sp. CER19]MDH2416561.1 LLM class flavin-dependent oxidoreductase [Nocardioides sp. CER19]
MRLGVIVMQTRPWRQLAADFRLMEELGYDAAYVYDHLTHPTAAGGWLADGFTTLAAAAGVTDRMELGPLVASGHLHSPVALARLAATVQDVSGGRLVLGLGAGAPGCALADRDETVTGGQLSARLVDVVEGLQAVWGGATEWRGRAIGFSGVETTPLPPAADRPFLLLAAHGPRALALAARHADGWNTYGGPGSTTLAPEQFWAAVRDQAARFEDACVTLDRDPASLRRSLLLGFGSVRPTASVEAYRDAVGRAAGLGFDELVVYGPFTPPGDHFHSTVEVHAEVLAAPH